MLHDEMIFKLKSDFLKALAHPVRLAIIEQLKHGELSVGDLGRKLGIEQSAVSKNLAILRQAGILSSRQEKVTVYYAIREQDIFKVLRLVADLLGRKLRESQKALVHLAKR